MAYLMKKWYIACFTKDVVRGKAFSRTLLDIDIVFFRNEVDEIAAMENRCVHRFSKLCGGKVENGTIQCPYHGMVYDAEGVCISLPLGSIPPSAKLRSFLVQEKDGIVWIWPDQDKESAGAPPDYDHFRKEGIGHAYMHFKCNYELMNDNIMDLSHADFLHPQTLGSGAICIVPPEVEQDGDSVTIRWSSSGKEAPPMNKLLMKEPESPVDEIIWVTWDAPAQLLLKQTIRPHDPEAGEEQNTTALHIMTPETASTTHYFTIHTTGDIPVTDDVKVQLGKMTHQAFFDEDRPMMEAIQVEMGEETDLFAHKPVLLPHDAGAVRVRRILKNLIEQERAESA